jgi:lipid-A-disaccharide synthase
MSENGSLQNDNSQNLPVVKMPQSTSVKRKKILMIAAEASSVLYAQRLMQHWQKQGHDYEYFGIGNQEMLDLNFRCVGRAEELAVMGFVEVLRHYSDIRRVFYQILDEVKTAPPQVAVLLDYPGFNLKLAKELHALKIPVVYYISPQIWAWKKNRVFTVKKYVSKMLCIFPFEAEFYKKFDVPVEFIGHPLLDELDPALLDEESISLQRERMGIPKNKKVLGLMPGSRWGEVERHLPIQIEVARRLYKMVPDLFVMVMVAPTFNKEEIADRLENLRIPYILVKDEPFHMIRLADSILAASGTATLMVGLMEKPMVIMYIMNWLTAIIGRWMIPGFFGLVNIINNREIVPEIFQRQAKPEVLCPLLEKSLLDKEYRIKMISELKQLQHQLGDRGATGRVAKSIEVYLSESV